MDKRINIVSDEKDTADVCQNAYFAYLNEIGKYKLLSADEELVLFQKISAGDNVAKDLFIKSNLRLVVKIAKKYYVPGYNDLLDLIQEGTIGLIKAVERFDISRGRKFSTFAFYTINKAIQQAPLRSGLPLGLSAAKVGLVAKIKTAIASFEEENERKPSTMELSSVLRVPAKHIAELMPFVVSSLSLNDKIGNNETGSEKEIIDVFEEYYSDDSSDIEEDFIAKETREELRGVIAEVLNKKETYIIYSRWGLSNAPIKEVSELAAELNMSKQGVRQCEERARAKLSKYLLSHNSSLSDFI